VSGILKKSGRRGNNSPRKWIHVVKNVESFREKKRGGGGRLSNVEGDFRASCTQAFRRETDDRIRVKTLGNGVIRVKKISPCIQR